MGIVSWIKTKFKKGINVVVADPNPRERMDLKFHKAKVPVRISNISVQRGTYYDGVNIRFTIGNHPKEYYAETTNSERHNFDYSGYKGGQKLKLRDLEKLSITEAVRRIVINNILHEYKKDMVDIIFMTNTVEDTDKRAHFDYTIPEDF